MARTRPTFAKLQREKLKKEKQQEKREQKEQKKIEGKKERNFDEVDPDLIGIIPGPQPRND